MLSGDILIRSPLSVALLPPPSLVELCRTMAAIVTLSNQQNIDDDIDDIYLGKYLYFIYKTSRLWLWIQNNVEYYYLL